MQLAAEVVALEKRWSKCNRSRNTNKRWKNNKGKSRKRRERK